MAQALITAGTDDELAELSILLVIEPQDLACVDTKEKDTPYVKTSECQCDWFSLLSCLVGK